AEPLGCSSTIILKEFKQHGVEFPANIAGMMLSAIISDTLLLKSPTTTDEDVAAVKELAKIAGVDYEKYGLDMLKAGTNLASKSDETLISQDAKSFDMNGTQVRVDQFNTFDLNEVFDLEDGLRVAFERQNKETGYALFFLLVTNILKDRKRTRL